MSAAAKSKSGETSDKGNQTKAENIPAIERASERSWSDWLALFEAADAAKLPRSEIARIALEGMPQTLKNPHWWAQAATIAFEQHAGLRVPGQTSTGEYRVSASRTMACDRDESTTRWITRFAEQTHLGYTAHSVRTSRTEKRTFWRASLAMPASEERASKLEVGAEAKPDGRSLVSISHTGLPGPEVIEEWRAYWKVCLAEL